MRLQMHIRAQKKIIKRSNRRFKAHADIENEEKKDGLRVIKRGKNLRQRANALLDAPKRKAKEAKQKKRLAKEKAKKTKAKMKKKAAKAKGKIKKEKERRAKAKAKAKK